MTVGEPSVGPVTIVPAGGPVETHDVSAETSRDEASWWARYRANIAGRLSGTALAALEADARYVVERALPSVDGAFDEAAWPTSRVRTGMVVGSVQSGKTASMLGVAALALDAGVDLLILLAGTRVSLWLQTYERLLAQLDGSTPENAYYRRSQRLILPQGEWPRTCVAGRKLRCHQQGRGAQARKMRWLAVPLAIGRTPSGDFEIFIRGAEVHASSPLVRRHLQHGDWRPEEGGEPFSASRIVLPAAPHFASVAALIAIELLRAGITAPHGPQPAFSDVEALDCALPY